MKRPNGAVRARPPASLLALAAMLAVALGPAPAAEGETFTIDPAAERGRIDRDLVGFGWDGHRPLGPVAPLDPSLVRIDASLEQASPEPGVLHLGPLLDRVAAVRAAGGEPLVILSYMPQWLGEPLAGGRDPTRVAPADFDAWQALVHDVVAALATAPEPALLFEAWNEPDVPIFWQDSQTAWLETVTRSARAVAAVERETGLDVGFGGPAVAVPDPVWVVPFLARFRDPTLPLDFVSWHYYGNYPFLGPDGPEFDTTEPVHPIVGRPNPLTTPAVYGEGVELMRSWTDAALADSDRERPELVLDEWNLSAGGYDRRHDSHVGAAFSAATLIEMQDSALDAAAFFNATDDRDPGTGDHGAVFADGARKPVWWTFELWRRLGKRRVALAGANPEDGLFAIAARERRPSSGGGARARRGWRASVLVASFSASAPTARELTVEAAGGRVTRARVRRIGADHPSAAPERAPVEKGAARIALPPNSVALVEMAVARGARGPR